MAGNWLRQSVENSTGSANRTAQAAYGRGTPAGFPRLRRLPLPLNGWPAARLLTKGRGHGRAGANSTARALIERRSSSMAQEKQV